jgi:adenylate cyclase
MLTRTEQGRVARAKRLLYWGVPVLGLALQPLLPVLEESWGLSALFMLRGERAQPDDVAVVAIDEESTVLARPDARLSHANLIRILKQAGASIIVVDMFLHTESEYDERLGAAFASAGNVILTALLDRESQPGLDQQHLRTPVPILGANVVAVAPWLIPEEVQVDWVFQRDDSDRYTIPFVALQAYLYDRFMSLLRAVRPEAAANLPQNSAELGASPGLTYVMEQLRALFAHDRQIATAMADTTGGDQRGVPSLLDMYAGASVFRGNRLYINYYGRPRTVLTVRYEDVETEAVANLGAAFQGRVVFVGFSAQRQPGQRDDYPYVYSRNGLNLSGVEMGATALANLLHGDAVVRPAVPINAALVTLWGLLVAISFGRLRVRPSVIAGVMLCAAYGSAALLLFRAQSVWLPLVAPALQVLFAAALALHVKHLHERAQLTIGTTEEAALALTGRGKPEKTDHRVILIADEQGSKKWLKRVQAELDDRQRRMLEDEFALARDGPITASGGRINHLLADSMLAYWVTPDTGHPNDEMAAACRAALSIQAAIRAFNGKHAGYEVQLRLALDWGRISSRLNPSTFIKDWRMEGRAIHAAERLESLNKVLGTRILIAHEIASRIDRREFWAPDLGTFVFCDEQGDVVVDPIAVHELRFEADIGDDLRRWGTRYEQVLTAIRQRDWGSAITGLEELGGQPEPGRLVSRYLAWCRESAQEPACRWRGVIKVTVADKSQVLDRYLP